MRVDGTDHLTMNRIKEQTEKTEIQRTEHTTADAEVRKRQEVIRGKPLPGEEIYQRNQELEEAVKQANDAADAVNSNLRFQINEEPERVMVEVIDINRGEEAIKELPPERLVNLVGQIQDMIGFFVDEKR